jgi:hypothetical protein
VEPTPGGRLEGGWLLRQTGVLDLQVLSVWVMLREEKGFTYEFNSQ